MFLRAPQDVAAPHDLTPRALAGQLELIKAGSGDGSVALLDPAEPEFDKDSPDAVQLLVCGGGLAVEPAAYWVHLRPLARLPELLAHLCGGRTIDEAMAQGGLVVQRTADNKLQIRVAASLGLAWG
jgi:hypothetical protein